MRLLEAVWSRLPRCCVASPFEEGINTSETLNIINDEKPSQTKIRIFTLRLRVPNLLLLRLFRIMVARLFRLIEVTIQKYRKRHWVGQCYCTYEQHNP